MWFLVNRLIFFTDVQLKTDVVIHCAKQSEAFVCGICHTVCKMPEGSFGVSEVNGGCLHSMPSNTEQREERKGGLC